MQLQRIGITLTLAGVAYFVLFPILGQRSPLGSFSAVAMVICFAIAAILGIAALFIGLTLLVIDIVLA